MSDPCECSTVRVTGCLGSLCALLLSYAINKSILWGILHYIFGWLYVVYWLFTYTDMNAYINSWVVY